MSSSALLFVANWKMNMLSRDAAKYILDFRRMYKSSPDGGDDVALAPPFTLFGLVREELGGLPGVLLAAQNVHWEDFGAHTGEVSAPMLREFGASYAIVGHSERRQKYGETSEAVGERAKNALKHGIRPIICIGETLEEFESGKTNDVLARQLEPLLRSFESSQAEHIVIAYEPVWAIGTGRSASPEVIAKSSTFIVDLLSKRLSIPKGSVRLLYGGSSSPDNIEQIMKVPGIRGALVGGASLSAATFWSLIERGREAGRAR